MKKKMGQVWKTSWPIVMEDGLWIRRSGFKALHPNVSMHILHTVLCDIDKENLFNDPEFFKFSIISIFLMTLHSLDA